jgi:hypothetical protein
MAGVLAFTRLPHRVQHPSSYSRRRRPTETSRRHEAARAVMSYRCGDEELGWTIR